VQRGSKRSAIEELRDLHGDFFARGEAAEEPCKFDVWNCFRFVATEALFCNTTVSMRFRKSGKRQKIVKVEVAASPEKGLQIEEIPRELR
jgi:hypothetical protein